MNVLKSSNLISSVPKFTIHERGIIIIVVSKVLKGYDCQLRYFIFHTRYLLPMCITSPQRTRRSDTLSPLTSTSIAIISHSSGVSIYRCQSNNSILQCIRASHRFFNTYRIVKNRLSSSSLLIYVFPVTSSLRIFSSNCLRDDRAN